MYSYTITICNKINFEIKNNLITQKCYIKKYFMEYFVFKNTV